MIDPFTSISGVTGTATGYSSYMQNTKIMDYSFGKYQIKVILSLNNEFLGIEEVRINKDFLSYEERILNKGYHDVNEFYFDK